MRLNLGCGYDIKHGYTNVDFRKTYPDVYECDLSKFPWPWATGEVDEILMLDFLEHFPYRDTERILLECFRVLKTSGEVVIQVPDAEHLMHAYLASGPYLCNKCGESMYEPTPSNPRHGDGPTQCVSCKKCGQTAAEISEAAMMRLYGGQDYPGNFHHTCFTESSLIEKASKSGLNLVDFEEVDHQYANWNFKARFKKGDIW